MQVLGVSWGDRKGRRRSVAAVATAAALLVPGSATGAGAGNHSSALQQVIVQALPGAFAQAHEAVAALGGRITRDLSFVNGFAATVPAGKVARLDNTAGILTVTPDRVLRVQGSTYSASSDSGAPFAVQADIGSAKYWQNGYYGQGIGVAVIDSGVVPQDGLHNNVFYGPDLSPQVSDTTLKFLDTYGHGTFMAGLIAGRADAATRPYTNSANFVGVAPEATLVSVKVADALGNTQESAVVAGVEWAVEHRYDPGLNIKVINLSVGMPDTGYVNDPLASAVERAWNSGVTVVASAGNSGHSGLDLPAADPFIISVGALDNQSTAAVGDDKVASFSNTGSNGRNPDLVAPGTHLVGLRDSGSFIDTTFGSSGAVGTTLFRGSGTSEAAAVTSGAAALIYSQRPSVTPDEIKSLLMNGAHRQNGMTVTTAGAGVINLTSTYSGLLTGAYGSYPHAANYQTFLTNQWGGAWSGHVWQAPAYSAAAGGQGGVLSGSHWTGSHWTGVSWSGSHWTGSSWSSSVWANRSWS